MGIKVEFTKKVVLNGEEFKPKDTANVSDSIFEKLKADGSIKEVKTTK